MRAKTAIEIVMLYSNYCSSASWFHQKLTPCKCIKTHQTWQLVKFSQTVKTPKGATKKVFEAQDKNLTCSSHQGLQFICSELKIGKVDVDHFLFLKNLKYYR